MVINISCKNLYKVLISIFVLIFFLVKLIGLIRQPKWGHLKEFHAAVKLCSQTILYGTKTNISLGPLQQVKIFKEIFYHVLLLFQWRLTKTNLMK